MKKIIALMLCLVMALLVTACGSSDSGSGSDSDYENVVDKGELVIGITEYEPMDYQDKNGEWTGFDAEFAKAVAKKMGVEAKFIVIEWDNKFLELKSKSIDCIWNGMTISTEVEKNTSCSKPYAKNEQVVVMKKSEVDKYKDVKSMSKLQFAVESESAGQFAAKDNGLKFTAVSTQSDTLTEVMSGSVDACIIDNTMATSMTGEGTSYSDLAPGLILAHEEYGVGFRKGSDMTEKFNQYAKELKEDGTLEKLSKKYNVALAD